MKRVSLRIAASAAWLALAFAIPSCATQNTLPGVPRGILFFETPIYPNSFDIVATGKLSHSGSVLRHAWQQKAEQIAAGRPFRVSRITERISEDNAGGWPLRMRSVSGTITILDAERRSAE